MLNDKEKVVNRLIGRKNRYHIIIEGTDKEQMGKFFEEIQNKYSLYDNCVLDEVSDEDSVIEAEDRCDETGNIICTRPRYKENRE